MLWRKIIVGDQERALIAKNDCFGGILAPGEYRLFTMPGESLSVEKFNVRDLVFKSDWADYMALERPEIADRHFTRVETNDLQVAMIYVDGNLFKVMLPAKRMLFWRGVVTVTAEVVNVIDEPQVAAQKLPAPKRLGRLLGRSAIRRPETAGRGGAQTPISSFQRPGLSAINCRINSMHSASCKTSTLTPLARRCSSAPKKVWFSPAITCGIL
jgi:hypothetical protein